MNLDDFTTEQLFPVLQMITRMNVRVTHNWKLSPDQPWECRYYHPDATGPDQARFERGRTLREVLVAALIKSDRHP